MSGNKRKSSQISEQNKSQAGKDESRVRFRNLAPKNAPHVKENKKPIKVPNLGKGDDNGSLKEHNPTVYQGSKSQPENEFKCVNESLDDDNETVIGDSLSTVDESQLKDESKPNPDITNNGDGFVTETVPQVEKPGQAITIDSTEILKRFYSNALANNLNLNGTALGTVVPSISESLNENAIKRKKPSFGLKVLLFLALVWIPLSMEMGPLFELPFKWKQKERFYFIKRRVITLEWESNFYHILIRSILNAILPMVGILKMSSPDANGVRVPRFDGSFMMAPVNINCYFICLIPYFLRLIENLIRYIHDNNLAYCYVVLNTLDEYDYLRFIIFITVNVQIAFVVQILLTMLQGCFYFGTAFIMYLRLEGRNPSNVMQLDKEREKVSNYVFASEQTRALYGALQKSIKMETNV